MQKGPQKQACNTLMNTVGHLCRACVLLQAKGGRTCATQGQLLSFAVFVLFECSPGPAVVPPTAASALLMKVAIFCSLAVGGRPPTYTRRACRVACWLGAASAAAEPVHRTARCQCAAG